jgi:hypothetical protein
VFITLCEEFLGFKPHFGLWKKIFYVKRYRVAMDPLSLEAWGLWLARRLTISVSQ